MITLYEKQTTIYLVFAECLSFPVSNLICTSTQRYLLISEYFVNIVLKISTLRTYLSRLKVKKITFSRFFCCPPIQVWNNIETSK